MNALLTPIRRFADFRGRSSRREFWRFVLAVIIAEVVLAIADRALGFGYYERSWYSYQWGMAGMADWNGGFLTVIFWLAMLIPSLALAARRLHDANHSAAWMLLWFVPAIGWLVLLIFYLQQSWPVANRWGAPPVE